MSRDLPGTGSKPGECGLADTPKYLTLLPLRARSRDKPRSYNVRSARYRARDARCDALWERIHSRFAGESSQDASDVTANRE